MNRNWITIIAVFVCAVSLIGGSTAAAEGVPPGTEEAVPVPPYEAGPLDETCATGHVCVWTEYNFQGAKGESLCTGGAHSLAGYKQSGKNRCANKAVWFRENGAAHYCLNPSTNENYFFYLINEIWVGAEGSRC